MSTTLLLLALAHADIAPGRPLPQGPCDGTPTGSACRTEQGLAGTCMSSPPPSPQTGDSLGLGWIFPRCVPDDPDARARMLRGETAAPPSPAAPAPAAPTPAPPSPAAPAPAAPTPPVPAPDAGCGCDNAAPTAARTMGFAALLSLAGLRRRPR
jgi:hypothetical protein